MLRVGITEFNMWLVGVTTPDPPRKPQHLFGAGLPIDGLRSIHLLRDVRRPEKAFYVLQGPREARNPG